MLATKEIPCTLEALSALGTMTVAADTSADEWDRIKNLTISLENLDSILRHGRGLGVTAGFREVLATFPSDQGVIPAGFRPEPVFVDECLRIDLKRDIAYGENGIRRPTNVLFSADSANPYEVAEIKSLIANLTCNPAIIYNNFINNPQENIGGKFKDRYEVMTELCRILGPGADISVEVDDPFADESAIIEEISRFEEILTPYRLVVKIPHTGPVNRLNSRKLLDGTFDKGYEEGSLKDNLYGLNLAASLSKRGYRINFTLMFEPHQMALALQTKPYFINTFIKQRANATFKIKELLEQCGGTDSETVSQLREYMRSLDMLSISEFNDSPDSQIMEKARHILEYRRAYEHDGLDGLDATRHGLRVLRNANLPDTRLIICSMSEEKTYLDIDKLLTEPEFSDMTGRVVITAPPAYLSRYASASGILTYQRMFLGAVQK